MKTKRGEYVRVVVRLPRQVVEELQRQNVPLNLYVKRRLSLLLSNLNVLMGVLSACARLEDCREADEKKSAGIYLHQTEYRLLVWHVSKINEYLRKQGMPMVSLNKALYLLLTDACHERKAN